MPILQFLPEEVLKSSFHIKSKKIEKAVALAGLTMELWKAPKIRCTLAD